MQSVRNEPRECDRRAWRDCNRTVDCYAAQMPVVESISLGHCGGDNRGLGRPALGLDSEPIRYAPARDVGLSNQRLSQSDTGTNLSML